MFEAIGNNLGRFIHVEVQLLFDKDKSIGCMLVELDIVNGLLAEVEIVCQWRELPKYLTTRESPFHV